MSGRIDSLEETDWSGVLHSCDATCDPTGDRSCLAITYDGLAITAESLSNCCGGFLDGSVDCGAANEVVRNHHSSIM